MELKHVETDPVIALLLYVTVAKSLQNAEIKQMSDSRTKTSLKLTM